MIWYVTYTLQLQAKPPDSARGEGEWSAIRPKQCVEKKEEPKYQDYGGLVGAGRSRLHLKSRSRGHGTEYVTLLVTYEHVRGTPDGGNVTGPGYIAVQSHAPNVF